jgi:hypothetical protein
MTYDRFERPQGAPPGPVWDHTARCRWLRRQAAFDSGPYEQAAKVFRQDGYTREAEQIIIAQRRHARQVGWPSATWPQRALDAAYATIGYGYRPARVLWALAGLLILVAASTWYPDPHVRGGELLLWWLNIATMLGWLLSSIFLLSLARLSRSTLQAQIAPSYFAPNTTENASGINAPDNSYRQGDADHVQSRRRQPDGREPVIVFRVPEATSPARESTSTST